MTDVNDPLFIFDSILGSAKAGCGVSNGEKQVNLLLLGKTGHGKSATGNTTLGRREFTSSSSTSSVTSEVKCSRGMYKNYVINIIDTPGLADTKFENCSVEEMELFTEHMKTAMGMTPGGIHAFLFVVKFGNRFTHEDTTCLEALRQIFGPRFMVSNGIIVFTHGDLFEQSMEEVGTPDKSFSDWSFEEGGALGDLISECGFRCVLFNNRQRDRAASEQKMEELVKLVSVFEKSYTPVDFQQFSGLRMKLILHLKLPKVKEHFQREMDILNRMVNLRRTGENADFCPVFHKLDQLTHMIANKDRGTGLLNDMKTRLSAAREKINLIQRQRQQDLIQRQQETGRQENESSCFIM